MTHRMCARIVLLTMVPWLAGCGGTRETAPLAPTPVPQIVGQAASVVVNGSVYDSAIRPLRGARVEVVDGPQAGMSTTTGATGSFSLSGAFNSGTKFRATHEGHVTTEKTWTQCASCPQPWLGFTLALVVAPVTIAGDYTVTFIADGVCPDLPDDLRTRTYAATISPTRWAPEYPANTSLQATVTGAPFWGEYESIWINVAGDYVSFWVGDHGPGIVEQVAVSTKPDHSPGHAYLALEGAASATVADPSSIAASLDGVFTFCALNSEMKGPYYSCAAADAISRAQCVSNNHRLILTRR